MNAKEFQDWANTLPEEEHTAIMLLLTKRRNQENPVYHSSMKDSYHQKMSELRSKVMEEWLSMLDSEKISYTNSLPDKPKNREGDQPMPTQSEDSRDVQEALLQMIRERRQVGIQRYGSPLMTHNGRDALQDALEEAVDLAAYLMQLRMERGKEEDKGFTYQYLLAYVSDNFHVVYGQEGIITQVFCKQHGLVASFPRERLEHGERKMMSSIGLHMDLKDHDEWKKYS